MTRVTIAAPATNLEMPSADELVQLRNIAASAHPEIDASFDHDEFRRAFWCVGQNFRTPAPRKDRFYSAWIDQANELLERQDAAQIGGPSFLVACIAAGDITWQAANADVGALLEIGLDPYRGRPCSNVWRDVLSGRARLLAPFVPKAAAEHLVADLIPRPRVFQERNGEMVQLRDDEPLRWST